MSDMLMMQEKIVGEDGKIVLDLPPGKHVRIMVEDLTPLPEPNLTPEEKRLLDAEFEALLNDPATFTGLGLTAAEIAASPEIGMWKDRQDTQDPVQWVSDMRRRSLEKRLSRND